MKYKVVPLYSYSELSDEAKEQVKQWYIDDPLRSEDLTDQFKESFVRYFFPNSNLNVEWSLNSCRGDGVNICGELRLFYVLDYIERWNPNEHGEGYTYCPLGEFTPKEISRLRHYIGYDHQNVHAVSLPSNRHYSYCVAGLMDEFVEDMIGDLKYWGWRNIDKELVNRFQYVVIKIITGLCKEMERYGYSFLYDVSNEEVAVACESNEWTFTADGKFEVA